MSTKVWSMLHIESVMELIRQSIAPTLRCDCESFRVDYSSPQQHDATVLDTELAPARVLNIDRRYDDEEHYRREVVLRDLVEQRFGPGEEGIPPDVAVEVAMKKLNEQRVDRLDCDASPQYVTLDQSAAIVSRAKKTVERAINADRDAPKPDIEGGGGRRHEWLWSRLRPWLENKHGRALPERYPVLR